MLGKLIKYDMKVLNRFLILIHAFLLFAAVCGRFFLTSKISLSSDMSTQALETNQFLLSLAMILFVVLVCAASFGTYIIIAVRFYKNLYSDEGYLTHTLPVSKGMHLLSKTISGSLWSFIDSILVFISMWIVIMTPAVLDAITDNKAKLLAVFGLDADFSMGFVIGILVLFTVLSAFANVIMIYAAIVCGQLFSGHRILGAVVSYLCLETVISIITLLVLTVTGYFSSMIVAADVPAEQVDIARTFIDIFKYSGALMVASTLLLYIGTYYLMNKKVNLQ